MNREKDTSIGLDSHIKNMVELETIRDWIRPEYNNAVSIYVYSNRVRLTNGSAASYIDIYPHGNSLILEGEKYGDTINTSCDATQDALLDALSKNY